MKYYKNYRGEKIRENRPMNDTLEVTDEDVKKLIFDKCLEAVAYSLSSTRSGKRGEKVFIVDLEMQRYAYSCLCWDCPLSGGRREDDLDVSGLLRGDDVIWVEHANETTQCVYFQLNKIPKEYCSGYLLQQLSAFLASERFSKCKPKDKKDKKKIGTGLFFKP